MDSFKRFNEEKLPDNKWFYSSVKDGTTDDNGENNKQSRLFNLQKNLE